MQITAVRRGKFLGCLQLYSEEKFWAACRPKNAEEQRLPDTKKIEIAHPGREPSVVEHELQSKLHKMQSERDHYKQVIC